MHLGCLAAEKSDSLTVVVGCHKPAAFMPFSENCCWCVRADLLIDGKAKIDWDFAPAKRCVGGAEKPLTCFGNQLDATMMSSAPKRRSRSACS
jgi:hypothetical protein